MKREPVTKRDKKNKTTSKNLDDDIMLGKCKSVIVPSSPKSKRSPKNCTQIRVKSYIRKF